VETVSSQTTNKASNNASESPRRSAFRIGLIVNPVAGLGGAVAMRGSDGPERQELARARGGQSQAIARAKQFLGYLQAELDATEASAIVWSTCPGDMGANLLADSDWAYDVLDTLNGSVEIASTGLDTQQAAEVLATHVDLLLFVGGDGTARDIGATVDEQCLVLGVPAGVKMHSGVFAITPRLAAQVVAGILRGQFVQRVQREIRDYDEDANDLSLRTYGMLSVPEAAGFVQQTKVGGKESEPLALTEICADVLESMEDLSENALLVFGAGSSVYEIKQALAIPGTLRGVDVRCSDDSYECDVTSARLEHLAAEHDSVHLIVSFSRAQGFLFGRGNQQLSPGFLSLLSWPDDVTIVSTRTKLLSLAGEPLLVDTGSDELDRTFGGIVDIVVGYEERMIYRVAGGDL